MNANNEATTSRHSRVRRAARRSVAVSTFALGALGLAACGMAASAANSSTTAASSSSAAKSSSITKSAVITINNFAYSPSVITVQPGQLVKVLNKDTATHSVTESPATPGSTPLFNTGNISPGSSSSFHAPMSAGQYNYVCDIHSFMHGLLVVK